MANLTHLDETGAARMVDVSGKDTTEREAVAEAVIVLSQEAFEAVSSGDAPKGDVLAAARIAGIMAAKKTSELIPLCHNIALAKAEIAFENLPEKSAIRITATAMTAGRTGVEMEALTAAAIAALPVYDMTKGIDKAAVIESVRLVTKSGGKSGTFTAPPLRSLRKTPVAPSRGRPATVLSETAHSFAMSLIVIRCVGTMRRTPNHFLCASAQIAETGSPRCLKTRGTLEFEQNPLRHSVADAHA